MSKGRIIFATKNNHKMKEIREILDGRGYEILSMSEAGVDIDVVEDGTTFEENALIKSRTIRDYVKDAIVLSDDSGLEVEALGGEPGIYSSRYAENDAARIAKVLKNLEGKENRRARFVCVIAIAINGEVIETFEGEVKGTIVDAPRGSNGFGYDPIFMPDGYDMTFGEMSDELKNKISHRADAVRKALEFIEDEMSVLDVDF